LERDDQESHSDLLLEMLVYSMKAKQTTDLSNVEKLKSLLAEFRTVYFQAGSNFN